MRLNFLTDNLALKLFSLIVAIILFLFVNVESSSPVEVEFPVEYHTTHDMMITNDPPTRIVATLKGPWANFRSFMLRDLQPVIVDLTRSGPGSTRRRIDPQDLHPPSGMRVVAINPSEIEVVLDRVTSKMVPVEADLLGRPAFGYEIAEVTVDPKRVRVEGPRTKMQTLEVVYTRPVDLRERTTDYDDTVDLRPPAPLLRLVEKQSAKVHVHIREEVVQRSLTDLPVKIINGPVGARVEPKAVTVAIKGPRRAVDKLQKESLAVVVDAQPEASQGVDSFSKTVQLQPPLPDHTHVVGELPSVEVQLRVRHHHRRR